MDTPRSSPAERSCWSNRAQRSTAGTTYAPQRHDPLDAARLHRSACRTRPHPPPRAHRIKAQDGRRLRSAAARRDLALDRAGRDCEVVVRQLSRDPYRIEASTRPRSRPDSYAFGSTSRPSTGSRGHRTAPPRSSAFDLRAGRTWRAAALADGRLVVAADLGGAPVVELRRAAAVWLAVEPRRHAGTGVGARLQRRRTACAGARPRRDDYQVARAPAPDKQWFACDNWTSSPFRGRCYLAYSDFPEHRISIQTSTAARRGRSRSAPRIAGASRRHGVRLASSLEPTGALLGAHQCRRSTAGRDGVIWSDPILATPR